MISPELAKQFLAHNIDNRKVRGHRVKRNVDIINRGEWVITNDAIVVANTGRLLNGQHRLLAIAEAGKTVPALLLTGLPEANFHAMDCGLQRSAGDIFEAGGIEYANQAAAVANMLFGWTECEMILGRPAKHEEMPTRLQLQNTYLHYQEEITRAFQTIKKHSLRKVASISRMVLTDVVIQLEHGEETEIFWRLVSPDFEGAISKSHPARLLRDTLVFTKNLRADEVVAKSIIAFNAWCQGKMISQLRWAGSENPKVVPTIRSEVKADPAYAEALNG